jgi:cytochrome c553
MRTFIPLLLAFSLLAIPARSASTPHGVQKASVDFERDIKPIFAKHCLSCHGKEKQKNGLRLDRKADAFKGGDGGSPIVAGKPGESLLLELVRGKDKDRLMPPKGGVTPREIEKLEAWIEQGAAWPDDGSAGADAADWWSLKPLRQPVVPVMKGKERQVRNEIDRFILARLEKKGLMSSVEADRRTLIRRLSFDLTGLPPTLEEIEAFEKDTRPDAYESLVDRLLASPHYGERWARHWLDVVHFGESHGYDKDKPRPNAWPYRDYVIRSLNEDKPYARFVQEQVAGDVLFPGSVDSIEALGFLAAGPWDFIGHAEVPESKIDGKVARHLDRDDFVANTIGTFMGLTVHCAQCHNHKFDPITQEDYYRLQAVFSAIDRTDHAYDADPQIAARRAELERARKETELRLAAINAQARKKAAPKLAAVENEIAAAMKPVIAARPAEYGYHSGLSPRQDSPRWVQVDLARPVELERVVLRPCNDDFNNIGAGFGFPVRFKVELSDDPAFKTGVTMVADRTERDFPTPGTAPVSFPAPGKKGRYLRVTATKLASRQNDFMLALAELEAIDADGKNRAAGCAVEALDTIEAPVRWRKSNLTDGLYPPGPKLSADEIARLQAERKALQSTALGDSGVAELAAHEKKLVEIEADLMRLSGKRRVAYIGTVHTGGGTFTGTGTSGGKPRPIFILQRGDVTRPGKEVGPGAIRGVPGLSAEFGLPSGHTEGEQRAALARWLTDPRNPLTWRVMANRVWQYHFGRGLVETPNDFGKMGQQPTHPELLDWLAADLREHQSLKRLHRAIVTSSTYRQTSATNEACAKVDGDNRYLWRQNRRKLEAEAVRDSILAVAGKLDLTMGGPSFQDFVIEKPEHSPHYQYHLHDPEDPRAHRRAIYRFVVRSKQQPFMAALDCADPSLAVDKRSETMTPQQALALLNNKLAVAMARHFAERLEKQVPPDGDRIGRAFRLALGRLPNEHERHALRDHVKEHGLAAGCRVLLNLNEFVFVD